MRKFQYCRCVIRLAVKNVTRSYLKVPCVASVCITFFTVSLVIAQQPETGSVAIAINSPDIVKAGETVTFTITLDRAPNFKGYKEREHDPFREPNHVLNVELHKQ